MKLVFNNVSGDAHVHVLSSAAVLMTKFRLGARIGPGLVNGEKIYLSEQNGIICLCINEMSIQEFR